MKRKHGWVVVCWHYHGDRGCRSHTFRNWFLDISGDYSKRIGEAKVFFTRSFARFNRLVGDTPFTYDEVVKKVSLTKAGKAKKIIGNG